MIVHLGYFNTEHGETKMHYIKPDGKPLCGCRSLGALVERPNYDAELCANCDRLAMMRGYEVEDWDE